MPRLSLRIKLLIGVLLLLLPVLGLLLEGVRADYGRRREAVLDEQVRSAETIATLIDTVFGDSIDLGWALANDPALRSFDPALADPHLRRLALRYPHYLDIEIFNANGDSVGASFGYLPNEPRANVADTRHFQQAMATGRPVVSPVLRSVRWWGKPIVVVAVPILDDGPAIGTVHLVLDLGYLPPRLANVRLRPDDAITLLDPQGRIAFGTLLPVLSWEELDLSQLPEVQMALDGETVRTASFHNPFFGDTRVLGIVRSSEHGWVVSVSSPSGVVFAQVEERLRSDVFGFTLIALLGIIGAWLLSGYLVGPLSQLAAMARSLGRGELEQRAEIKSRDELEDLAEAFNRMASDLEAERERRELFLSAVAHDLRGPVTVIRGYGGMLRRWEEMEAERLEKAVAAIDDATRRLDRMVEDLLDVSRIAAGRFEVRPAPMELMALVRELVEAQQQTAPRHRLVLDGPPQVEGVWDRDRLAQVVSNLLSNAVKYSPEGGEVRVGVEIQAQMVHLRVADQGVGMRQEDLRRVFEPFRRLEETRSLAGAGLGLYISKGIVEAHGGRIWAESPGPSRGSTFHVLLPLAAPPGAD